MSAHFGVIVAECPWPRFVAELQRAGLREVGAAAPPAPRPSESGIISCAFRAASDGLRMLIGKPVSKDSTTRRASEEPRVQGGEYASRSWLLDDMTSSSDEDFLREMSQRLDTLVVGYGLASSVGHFWCHAFRNGAVLRNTTREHDTTINEGAWPEAWTPDADGYLDVIGLMRIAGFDHTVFMMNTEGTRRAFEG